MKFERAKKALAGFLDPDLIVIIDDFYNADLLIFIIAMFSVKSSLFIASILLTSINT